MSKLLSIFYRATQAQQIRAPSGREFASISNLLWSPNSLHFSHMQLRWIKFIKILPCFFEVCFFHCALAIICFFCRTSRQNWMIHLLLVQFFWLCVGGRYDFFLEILSILIWTYCHYHLKCDWRELSVLRLLQNNTHIFEIKCLMQY